MKVKFSSTDCLELNREQLQFLHAGLVRALNKPPEELARYSGVCQAWAVEVDQFDETSNNPFERTGMSPWWLAFKLVEFLAADWPESAYPGKQDCWPVPKTPYKWQGEGLQLRKSLMRYILKRLRDWIRRTPA